MLTAHTSHGQAFPLVLTDEVRISLHPRPAAAEVDLWPEAPRLFCCCKGQTLLLLSRARNPFGRERYMLERVLLLLPCQHIAVCTTRRRPDNEVAFALLWYTQESLLGTCRVSLLVCAYHLADPRDRTVSTVEVSTMRLSIINLCPLLHSSPASKTRAAVLCHRPPPTAASERVPGPDQRELVCVRVQALCGAKVWGA